MKIGVLGCAGRMGRAIMAEVLETEGCTLAGGTEMAGHAELGKDLGALIGSGNLDMTVNGDAAALIATSDVVIEFSSVEATVRHAAIAAEHGTGHVIGTTGLDDGSGRSDWPNAAETYLA